MISYTMKKNEGAFQPRNTAREACGL